MKSTKGRPRIVTDAQVIVILEWHATRKSLCQLAQELGLSVGLVQYVIARESFDASTLQADYRKVGLWSAEQARLDYSNLMRPANIDSPLVLYPRTSIVQTRVKSVSPMPDDTALVRFETMRRDAGGGLSPAQAWVAIIKYRFSGEPMSAEDRFLNPLGFQVTQYRRDPEALPVMEASPTVDPDATDAPAYLEAEQ